MGGYRQTTTENAKVEASLNLRLAESGAKNKSANYELHEVVIAKRRIIFLSLDSLTPYSSSTPALLRSP